MTARLFEGLPPFPEDVLTAEIPIVSLKLLEAEDELESDRLLQACQNQGCFQIDLRGTTLGEGILQQVEDLYEVGKNAFDLSLEEKTEFKMPPGTITGYKAVGLSTVDEKGSKDKWEAWSIPKDDILKSDVPLPYPEVLQQNRALLRIFCASTHDLSSILLRPIDARLRLPPGTLMGLHPFEGDTCSGTVARWVKCMPRPADDREISFVAHNDFGTLTILFNILGGLQILSRDVNQWKYIRPHIGHAVINVGEALSRFSGGLLKPVFHRVCCAPGVQSSLDRYSISYFLRPEDDVSFKRLVSGDVVPWLVDRSDEEELTVAAWNIRRGERLKIGDKAR